MRYVTVTLMTFDKQSNDRRTGRIVVGLLPHNSYDRSYISKSFNFFYAGNIASAKGIGVEELGKNCYPNPGTTQSVCRVPTGNGNHKISIARAPPHAQ